MTGPMQLRRRDEPRHARTDDDHACRSGGSRHQTVGEDPELFVDGLSSGHDAEAIVAALPADLHFLTLHEHAKVAAVADVLIPARGDHPGGGAVGVADYVDCLLGAFTFDPPRIWAGGPFSGRHGGDASFEEFLDLSRVEALAWRTRIEGSLGIAEREFNGPVVGWQQQYREGLAALGDDFEDLAPDEQMARLDAEPAFKALLYSHACEGTYGDPVYGGNRDGAAWRAIRYEGDVQPRGYTDQEVSGRE